MLGDQASARPDAAADPLDLEWPADRAAYQRVFVDRLRCLLAIAVDHHQSPHGIERVNDSDIRPQAIPVDGKKERSFRLADAVEEVGGAEEKVDRVTQDALPG